MTESPHGFINQSANFILMANVGFDERGFSAEFLEFGD
jgi:hypothetical protein